MCAAGPQLRMTEERREGGTAPLREREGAQPQSGQGNGFNSEGFLPLGKRVAKFNLLLPHLCATELVMKLYRMGTRNVAQKME